MKYSDQCLKGLLDCTRFKVSNFTGRRNWKSPELKKKIYRNPHSWGFLKIFTREGFNKYVTRPKLNDSYAMTLIELGPCFPRFWKKNRKSYVFPNLRQYHEHVLILWILADFGKKMSFQPCAFIKDYQFFWEWITFHFSFWF